MENRRFIIPRLGSILRKAFALVVAGLIFAAGYGVGSGEFGRPGTRPLDTQNNQLPDNLDYSSVEQVYDSLRARYDGELKAEELLDGLKEGLAEASGDPYTEFLDAEETEDFDEQLSGSFTGIGAELSREDDVIVVVAPIAGFPAEKAGLRPKDVISEIDGESALDLSVSEAVKKIRGPEGTKVTLTVLREGETSELKFEITRAQINIPSVTSEILNGNIGYMKISRFGEDTTELARQVASDFRQKNVKGVILDVRNNPGGLLNASVDLAGIWLNRGETVLEEKRGGQTIKTYRASTGAILRDVPTIVLINEGSASASEITAGALKDHGQARLLGEKTFGKGSVQELINFRDDTVLKVTIARWYTPGGKNIDHEGIEPDEKVERTNEDFTNNRDPQRDKALELLNQ